MMLAQCCRCSGEYRASAGYGGRDVVHLRVDSFGIEIERRRYE